MNRSRAGEIVPLADRIRYMQWLRGALAAGVLLAALLSPETRVVGLTHLLVASGGYIALSLAAEALWRRWPGRGLLLFGGMLLMDGLYLAGAVHLTGGNASHARYLIFLHVIAVTLLASYRTGLKIALWHSLLLISVHNLLAAGVLTGLAPEATGDVERLGAFAVVFWLVAFVTAACSAGNERELRRRKVDLEALAAMATRLESAASPATVSSILVDSVVDTFGFGRAALVGGIQRTALLASHGVAGDDYAQAGPASVAATAHSRRETLLVDGLDPSQDADLDALLPGARNLIVVSLVAEDRPIGALIVEHGLRRGSRVERRVVSTLERFVSHAALALRNAWLLEDVRSLAEVDQLTQIANRRVFDDALEAELSRATRNGSPVALILVDIDRFKQLNDAHGHQMGDVVLHGVAQALNTGCRPYDTVARYGGEEFAIVLPDCGEAEAAATAERLRRAVAHADVPVPVTASFGVALCPGHGIDPVSLISAADTALYAAKESGRNRVTLASATRKPVGAWGP